MSKAKVSVIIPVHNSEKYIEECINSLASQSLDDIEIICVDDDSSDESVNIIRDMAEKDSRIKLIVEGKPVGTSKARKDGVLASTGKYVMFLDSDDLFAKDACKEAYELIEDKKADIVHFNTEIIGGETNKAHIDIMKSFQKPPKGFVESDNLPADCFDKRLFGWNLWNKIYNGDICRKAFSEVCDEFLIKAEDMYVFFIILTLTKKYYGAQDSNELYIYRLGAGGTGKTNVSLELIEAFCNEHDSACAIKDYLVKNGIFEEYEETCNNIFDYLLRDCVWNWFEFVSNSDAAAGFDILCRHWGALNVISMLTRQNNSQFTLLAKKVAGAKTIEADVKSNPKRIGIFYHRYFEGGVERVLSLLIPMYIKMGYEVVFFTDSVAPEKEYELPESVIRVHTPSAVTISFANYKKRGQAIEEALNKYNIDVMIYHAASCRLLLSDMLLFKSHGIPFVIMKHEMFSQHMAVAAPHSADYIKYYSLADKLLVLSEIEAKYDRLLGVNAEYMQNPIDNFYPQKFVGDYIFWLGRFDTNQKQYLDAVEICDKLVSVCPDAQMIMLGSEYDPGSRNRLVQEINNRNLQDNLHLHDFTPNVETYYLNARVHLVTSAYEAFPMTFIESKSHGIPLVTYDMPYLQILKDKKGYIAVEQGDTDAAAEALAQLWKNRDLCEKMSEEALESINDFKNVNLEEMWKDVIDRVCSKSDSINVSDSFSNDEVHCIISSMLFHYKKGIDLIEKQKSDLRGEIWSANQKLKKEKKKTSELQKKVKSLETKNKKMRRSISFRIGRIITLIPRRLKKLLLGKK